MCLSVSVAAINELLFPSFLFCIYLAIALSFWACSKKTEAEIKNPIVANRDKTSRKQKGFEDKSREISLRFLEDLKRFDRYTTYRICMILDLEFKSFEQYKPLDLVKAEILEKFRASPKEVMAAVAIVFSGNCC